MQKVILVIAAIFFISLGLVSQDMKHDKMDHAKKETAIQGWISDSECAAAGVKNCSKKEHVANGAKLVVVSDPGGKIYTVTNPDTVAEHQGHRVNVTGSVDESARTITVTKLSMLN